jgi:hypothetical protein
MPGLPVRLFWHALDRAACAVTLAWLSLLDRICGPEPPTPADEKPRMQRLIKGRSVIEPT